MSVLDPESVVLCRSQASRSFLRCPTWINMSTLVRFRDLKEELAALVSINRIAINRGVEGYKNGEGDLETDDTNGENVLGVKDA